jgi:hypothetical protein
MKLRITITMRNAAFEESKSDEAGRILLELAEHGDFAELCEHGGKITLRDINGNPAGKAVVSVAPED